MNMEHVAKYKQALAGLLKEPYGCGRCDSGKLRTPKDHFDDCPYKIATELLNHETLVPADNEDKKDEVDAAEKELKSFNNVEWDSDGDPLYNSSQMIVMFLSGVKWASRLSGEKEQGELWDAASDKLKMFCDESGYMGAPIQISQHLKKVLYQYTTPILALLK